MSSIRAQPQTTGLQQQVDSTGRAERSTEKMVKTQVRWEQMDKSKLPLSDAVEHYLIACQTEGKSPQTLTGYREKLKRYLNDAGGTVGDFAIEKRTGAHRSTSAHTPLGRPAWCSWRTQAARARVRA